MQGECDKPPPPPPSSLVREERGRPRGPARPQTLPSGQHPEQAPAAELRDGTMLVTLKTLQQQTFKIDIDPDDGECGSAPGPARSGAVRARGREGLGWGGAAGPRAGPRPQLRAQPGAGRAAVHPRGHGERGLRDPGAYEACGFQARVGARDPAACGPLDLQGGLWALWQECGSSGRTPKPEWHMA